MEWIFRVLCISVLTGSCISRATWNEQYEKELRSDINTEVDNTVTKLLEEAQENLKDLELELAYEKKRDGETERNVFDEILDVNTMEVETDQHLLEGDIKLPVNENAIPDRARLWPKSPNTIPYSLASSLTESDIKAITAAHSELQDVTNGCLQFEKRKSEVQYLEYFKGSGCWSYIGRIRSGKQQISIGRGCGRTYIVIHETLHALGFFHEQSRSDRDDFVKINFGNIKTGMEGNFRKANTDNLGTDYDFNGIMHYGATAFTKNGLPTIEVLPKYKDKITRVGNIGKLTEIDIDQLNKLYSCQTPGTGWSTWSNWGTCSATCGVGTQTKTRRCKQGSTCTGDSSQSQSCKVKDCGQPDCSCMDYVNRNGYGNCLKTSKTLGGLSCYVNLPTTCSDARRSGSDPGKKYSAVACRNGNGWSAWSNWGACSATCGFGTQTKTRRCNEGSTCTGDSSQSQSCKVKDCGQPGTCNCGMENISTKKRSIEISGGGFARPNQYPWMVRLRGCGGTLISNRHVLTAYHCVQRVVNSGNNWSGRSVKVSVHNQNDRNDYQVVPIKTCKFPKNTASHDIAILELDQSLTFDETIHPACLPVSSELSYINQKAMAMGWGMTHIGSQQSATLKYVELVVARKSGNYLYTHVGNKGGIPQDPCAGDSGGPLLHQDQVTRRWTIIGTVYGGGYDCRTGNGANGQGVWSRVTAHLEWIRKVLNEPGTSTCAPTPGPDADGNWSDWSSWGSCSQSCGGGTRTQTRTCTNPAPQGNGANCVGDAKKIEECNTSDCGTDVDGNWSEWSSWGSCSQSCDGGTRTQTRACTNPAPQGNGARCVGAGTKSEDCNRNDCTTDVDGGWSVWSSWGTCSRNCGGGTRTQTRACTNPTPQGNGAICVGNATQSGSCNAGDCSTGATIKSCTVTGVPSSGSSCLKTFDGVIDNSGWKSRAFATATFTFEKPSTINTITLVSGKGLNTHHIYKFMIVFYNARGRTIRPSEIKIAGSSEWKPVSNIIKTILPDKIDLVFKEMIGVAKIKLSVYGSDYQRKFVLNEIVVGYSDLTVTRISSVSFPQAKISITDPGKLKVEWFNGRPDATGIIDETGAIHTGYVDFPDDKRYTLFYYPNETRIYWGGRKGETTNTWTGSVPLEPVITCERSTMSLSCPVGKVINIDRANYGRTEFAPCPNGPRSNTRCYSDKSMSVVNKTCHGKSSCSVVASNRVFGDPCAGTYKYLQVEYTCEDALKSSSGKDVSSYQYDEPVDEDQPWEEEMEDDNYTWQEEEGRPSDNDEYQLESDFVSQLNDLSEQQDTLHIPSIRNDELDDTNMQ